MKFVEVDPDEIPNYRHGHRGRTSYPLIKSFLETGYASAKLDLTGSGIKRTFSSLYTGLSMYIKNHNLPIKLISREQQLYFVRLDLDKDGKPVMSPQDALEGKYNEDDYKDEEEVTLLTPEEVDRQIQ